MENIVVKSFMLGFMTMGITKPIRDIYLKYSKNIDKRYLYLSPELSCVLFSGMIIYYGYGLYHGLKYKNI